MWRVESKKEQAEIGNRTRVETKYGIVMAMTKNN